MIIKEVQNQNVRVVGQPDMSEIGLPGFIRPDRFEAL